MTIGPVSSGYAAASIIAAQPAWQLPTMPGFGASGCSSRTRWTNSRSALHTSSSVWPGSGVGKKITKYTGWPALQRHADLRVVLEAADARAMAAARVDDHVGAALRRSTVMPSGGTMRSSA